MCHVYDAGVVPYAEAWRWQQALLARRVAAAPPAGADAAAPPPPPVRNVVIALQHPHVYTLGRAATVKHLLWDGADAGDVGSAAGAGAAHGAGAPAAAAPPPAAAGPGGADVLRVDRGGKVTYHGPGQLVVYPVLDLRRFRQDLHWYVTGIEEAVIRTAAHFGVAAGREAGAPGVWARGRKVAAVGMACSKWYTTHGFALNVDADLAFFRRIVPCGLDGREATTLAAEAGAALTVADVQPVALAAFADVFDCDMVAATGCPADADSGGGTGGGGGRPP